MCIHTCGQCLLLILCILLPPLAVLIHGGCDINFCINILFTLLGGIPARRHRRPSLLGADLHIHEMNPRQQHTCQR
ncbi:unnamed protein product, partial [Mesorhabditis spiculigera]